MSRQVLFLGTTADDDTGTDLRAGGDIINDNCLDLYQRARRHPGYRSGTYYAPVGLNTGTVTVTANNRLYAAPFRLELPTPIASLFMLTISHVAGNAKFALYDTDYGANTGEAGAAGDCLPNNLIDSCAATASSANNTIIGPTALAGGNRTLDPGVYWFASMYDAAIGIHGFNAGDRNVGAMIGGNNAPRALGAASSGISGVYADSTGIYTAGFPSTFPTPTINFTGGTPYGGWVTP